MWSTKRDYIKPNKYITSPSFFVLWNDCSGCPYLVTQTPPSLCPVSFNWTPPLGSLSISIREAKTHLLSAFGSCVHTEILRKIHKPVPEVSHIKVSPKHRYVLSLLPIFLFHWVTLSLSVSQTWTYFCHLRSF